MLSILILWGFKDDEISSFFIMFNSVNRFEMTDIRKKWDSAQRWRAEIELVNEDMPVR